MSNAIISTKDLEEGKWTLLEYNGDIEADNIMVRMSGTKFEILPLLLSEDEESYDITSDQIFVVDGEIFEYDTRLAVHDIKDMEIETLISTIIFCDLDDKEFSPLVFNLLHYHEELLREMYVGRANFFKLVYEYPHTEANFSNSNLDKPITIPKWLQ